MFVTRLGVVNPTLTPVGTFFLHWQSVLLNLVLAVVLEGASDQMKEKHAAQQFRDNTLRLFHNQYKRLAMRRWSAKLRAEAMLERGVCAVFPRDTYEKAWSRH